jgi:hypothetical protein
MRRIDAIAIALGVFLAGGLVYFVLQIAGFDNINAGIWTQTFLVIGLVGWSLTYLIRVGTKNMTYNKQLKDYKDAVLQKRLEEMSPEEFAELEAEIAAERSQSTQTD